MPDAGVLRRWRCGCCRRRNRRKPPNALRFDGIAIGATLATLDADAGYGLVENAALAWKDGVIAYAGPHDPALESAATAVHRFDGGVIAPGLVDCHTHLVFAGDRRRGIRTAAAGRELRAHRAPAAASCSACARCARRRARTRCWPNPCTARAGTVADGATTLEIVRMA